MKKVELLGLDIEVEFEESNIYQYEEEDGTTYDAVVTTDNRLIVFDEPTNSWLQIAQN